MSVPLFNGDDIWGGQTYESGPMAGYRNQREVVPGINGFRNYRLGKQSWIWVVRGRIMSISRLGLETMLEIGAGYIDGLAYEYTTAAGTVTPNCFLNDFRPIGNVQKVRDVADGLDKWTVEVQGTVEWAAPA